MRLRKLIHMTPVEMAFRGRQAIYKAAERFRLTAAYDMENSVTDTLMPQSFKTDAKHFFAGPSNPLVPGLIRLYMPGMYSELIRSAEAVRAGNFYTLGYGRLGFSTPEAPRKINWHLDAVSGTVSPRLHWSRINALDFDQVGDSKVVWELSRHQWMIQLGLAWQLTGHESCALTFAERIQDWIRDNPVGIGINWSSALEVSYRLISWCWALSLFQGSSVLSPALLQQIITSVEAHARHIARYLSVYYSPNTHLTGEALGLYYAGTLFPTFGEAPRWRQLGRDILLAQLLRQVYKDGVHFEQSTRYQHYTAEFYLHFIILSRRRGDPLPEAALQRVQSMLDFLLDLRRPDGSVPQIGDTDGGSLLPLLHRVPGDMSALFAVAAVVFGRADYAWATTGSCPELLCLLGPTGHYALLAMQPQLPPPRSALYADGGYFIMRNNRLARGHQMIVDIGPLGCPDSAAHGHADLLAIQCSGFGENYLVDPGTDNYTAEPVWRNHFRSTAAHNSVCVDGQSQAVPAGPFSWHGRRPQVTVHRCLSGINLSLLDASHQAWSSLPDPVVHRRRIVFIRQRYWIMVDDISMHKHHDVVLHFQFAPLTVTLEDQGWVRACGRQRGALLMHIGASCATERALSCGQLDPVAGWVSDNYGQRRQAPALSVRAAPDSSMRFTTILWPASQANAELPVLRTTESTDAPGTDYLSLQLDDSTTDEYVISTEDILITHRPDTCVV